jgi:uncharacterized protein GlcG (DUF336 family)
MANDPETLALIPYALAARAIEAGMAFARDKGVTLSFAVVDSAGHLVAAARMDGAPFVTIEVARGKAFASAATGGQPGGALAQRYRDNPMVWGNAGPLGYGAPMLPAQGSLPIWRDGRLLGAIGASGAPSDVDEAALAHALETIGAKPSG